MKKVPKRIAAPDSTLAIVEREFELKRDDGESKVFTRLRRPVPDGEATFRCDVEIEGLGDRISTDGVGVDGIQAYELALQSAALHLLSSPAYQGGQLTLQGSYDLRLPIPESLRYLVRTDLERDLVVREMAGRDDTRRRFSEASLARLQDKSKVWPDPKNAPLVLERVFDLRRGRKRTAVRVSFHKPVPNRLGHWCAFKIDGLLAKPHTRKGMLGDDPIESLRNAMRLAMVYIVSSPAYQRGQLTWLGMYDLGMPIVEEVEPLIRKDLHAKAMAELMPRRSKGASPSSYVSSAHGPRRTSIFASWARPMGCSSDFNRPADSISTTSCSSRSTWMHISPRSRRRAWSTDIRRTIETIWRMASVRLNAGRAR